MLFSELVIIGIKLEIENRKLVAMASVLYTEM